MNEQTDYCGWKSYSTWNVALWLGNEEAYYNAAVKFMQKRVGKKWWDGYGFYRTFASWYFGPGAKTGDDVSWMARDLDHRALDEWMLELVMPDKAVPVIEEHSKGYWWSYRSEQNVHLGGNPHILRLIDIFGRRGGSRKLAKALEATGMEGQYLLIGHSIWATHAAIDAAVEANGGW